MPSGSRLALLVVLVPMVAAVGAADTGPQHAQIEDLSVQNTTLEVSLQPDGDARWTVTATFNLTTENETDAFRTLAGEFTDGRTASLGLPAFREAASAASRATGREMAITDVDRRASPDSVVANGTGRLTLSFTWTNFARIEGDRLVLEDVFHTAEGTWLSGIEADQRLVIEPPAGYGVFSGGEDVPAPQNGTLRWAGPASFGPDSLSITFTGSGGSTTPNGSGPPANGGDSTPAMLLLVVLTLGGGAAVAYVIARRQGDRDDGGEAPAVAAEDPDDAAAAASDPEDSDAAGAETAADDGIDEELLSDEERIEHLLEENGGRMKQATIVKETGWSNAKVSQLLSAMDEADRINKLRIGRENLISFPDEDVTDLDDPE